ncbi:Protein FAM47E [Heterocephalus glaber]|uniref:Protein FAM47E n=1 Tax=Heterocephalus glaber TaxID=10181 RepID=G5C417_HETGA|nr:Protein FAM47E [Heterocephalus glaber]
MMEQRWHLRPRVHEPVAKCFAKHKSKLIQFSISLDGRRWIFVREDLDDFRKGCPHSEGLIIRGTKEAFIPMVAHRVPQPGTKNSQRKPKDASLCSTLSSAQLARKTFMHDLQACLAQKSSALYSTLEEDVPADLLLTVLKVLDPDRKLEDTWNYCEGLREGTKKPTKFSKQGIHDFCRWVYFGGDFSIREVFLFDIGFEFKPTYDENQMKKINLLPPELRYCKGLKKSKEIIFSIQELDFDRKHKKPKNPYQPKHEKIRYGAWYLKPKLWKKLINDETLIDPKILAEAQREPPPDIIEDIYGTIAFKDFIVSKGYSMRRNP